MSEEAPRIPDGPALQAPRSVRVTWAPAEHRFAAVGSHAGRSIVLNAPHPEGTPATGFSPAELVLAGVGACSAWDVVQVLGKARQELTDLEVQTVGAQQAEQPFPFRDVRLHYVVTGRRLKPGLVHRAVRLSHERYCSAIATIRGVAEIGYTVEIRESREP
jgi:putative redox protein